ncbi:MAG: SEC-C domain-containing protein [bacterium]|nr:SEC-C domain-containing protein [bacterium]
MIEAARAFYAMKPWETATVAQLIRMDIPDLGLVGAGVVVMGAGDEPCGFAIFPTPADYEAFLAGPLGDRAGEWWELVIESGADTLAARSAGSPVPVLSRVDGKGSRRAPSDQDTRLVGAAVSAFASYFGKYRRLFAADAIAPVCESYFDRQGREVRFCAPYEAHEDFDVTGAMAPRPAGIGRNDPCHCGSGRKYKHCHLRRDQQTDDVPQTDEGRVENRLIKKLVAFAQDRFAGLWRRSGEVFLDDAATAQLAIPWALYGHEVDGHTVLDWYLREGKGRLDKAELEMATAQLAAWLSVWEVVDVAPGESLVLQDLLSGEARRVREKTASRTLNLRDAILARVSDHDGTSLLNAVHPRPLLPDDAAEVVRLARGRLRLKRAVPPGRLRDGAFGGFLIRTWEEQVEVMDQRRLIPPRMSNTDGDVLLLTTDRFRIASGDDKVLAQRLEAVEGVVFDDPDRAEGNFAVLRSADPGAAGDPGTVIGHGWIVDGYLTVGTNSVRRADNLKSLLTAWCAGLLEHVSREHPAMDVGEDAARSAEQDLQPEDPISLQVIREFKERHYADWADQPLPALGGRTPRETVRTAQGRREVDLLIKTMENMEHRGGGSGVLFDFAGIRRELGLG